MNMNIGIDGRIYTPVPGGPSSQVPSSRWPKFPVAQSVVAQVRAAHFSMSVTGNLACALWFQQQSISQFLGHPVLPKIYV